ncbi:MAG: glycosyltransferase [Candidatus Binatia bacterium]|nr:glycosyltransferase [Candidatus Binatia bacterium]
MASEPAIISVIVATRDRAQSLERLLGSLEDLDAPPVPYEIIVADNGSTDGTPSLLAEWRRHEEARTVVRVAEPGKSRAANSAIAASEGELLAFVDDDVVTDKRWLVEIWNYFSENDCAAAQGLVDWPDEASADPALRCDLEKYGTIVRVHQSPEAPSQRLTGANMVLRRHAFNVVGGFNEKLGPGAAGASEDTELGQRILAVGGWIGYVEHARVVHEVDPTRLTESHFAEHHRRLGRSRFEYKHNGLLSSILPNLAKSAFQYGLYSVLRNDVRKYRAKGRLYHYSAMIGVRRDGGPPSRAA